MGPADLDGRDYPPELVREAKGGRFVSVCLPARDEAATVGAIVERIAALDVADEILVLDDGSTDGTARRAAAAGATVVRAAEVLPGYGPGPGKGQALWKAVFAAKGDVLVFCDADLEGFDPAFVTGLAGPLLADDRLGFVKGHYRRPGDGGRVTELLALPLIELLLPEVAAFRQPLAGEFSARREVLESLPFVTGYGVDLALLVDATRALGPEGVAQVDLGERSHRNRTLAQLGPQARAVAHVALHRAGAAPAAGAPESLPPRATVER